MICVLCELQRQVENDWREARQALGVTDWMLDMGPDDDRLDPLEVALALGRHRDTTDYARIEWQIDMHVAMGHPEPEGGW